MTEQMRHYLFVARDVVDQYIQQIPKRAMSVPGRSIKASFSITGPQVSAERNLSHADESYHEKILRLIAHLDANNMLARARPVFLDGWNRVAAGRPAFCLETVRARKVIIPQQHVEVVPGLREFAVWIAGPNTDDLSEEKWAYKGTFLYLTETHWDNGAFATVYSGCSALQAIVNAVTGRDLFDTNPTRSFGEHSLDHPIDKLKTIGGRVSDTRLITTLYRKRYFSNEQIFTWNEKHYRVNDLLGYPLFKEHRKGQVYTLDIIFVSH